MLYELSPSNYADVRVVFRPLEHRPFCQAVLEGVEAGRIFVDNLDAPQTAFMIVRDAWGYLAGNPHNQAFNQALNRAIFAREVSSPEVPLLQLICHPEEWHEHLAVICQPRRPVAEVRRYYVGRSLDDDWSARVPEGFFLWPIDEGLLEQPGLDLPDDVRKLIEARRSAEDPFRAGFGFVAVHGGRIAAYAMVDCVASEFADLFLFTDEAYRRRGLATVTSAATIAYGLERGLPSISWDCAAPNLGSLRTAERLGLERLEDYTMFYFLFDETGHQLVQIWDTLQGGRYQEVVDLCQHVMEQQTEFPLQIHLFAARAWASMDQPEKALAQLRQAAAGGWASLEILERIPEFSGLKGRYGWDAVVEQVRQNQRQS
jgi:RimJ/RimL family protein N-acetyltransferase